jgi:hypothetical protein
MKINQIRLNMDSITLAGNKVRLIGIRPTHEYKDNAMTDNIIGTTYNCVAEENNFEKFRVKVDNINPIISAEQLEESKTPIYISFQDFEGKLYKSWKTNTWAITCKAKSASIVKSK